MSNSWDALLRHTAIFLGGSLVYVNSCTLQQTNVIWKPILPSWAQYYRKANSLSFYPVRIHKRSSHKLAVLRFEQPLIRRLTAAMHYHERDEMLSLCCPAFHHLYAAAFRRAVS